jgi:tRNA threonylcarbamoyladenosine biosynthesis protein TsaE
MKQRIETKSPEKTMAVGRALAALLRQGDCIPLIGEMGSGKTTFVQGVARGLGVPESVAVNSPSFTLINRYTGRIPLYHIDLYRLSKQGDLEDIELDDVIYGDGVTLIEWPELILRDHRVSDLTIHFIWEMFDECTRTLLFTSESDRFTEFLKRI